MYTILVIANWFLKKESMTHKKLQKLCYYAQAWSLALFKRPIINSDFQAWVHGPVSPELYSYYKTYGWQPIEKYNKRIIGIRKDDLELLERVWQTYGRYDGQQLESITHNELPWLNARSGIGQWDNSHAIISNKDMETYYISLYIGD